MTADHYTRRAAFQDEVKSLQARENAWAKNERLKHKLTAAVSAPEQFNETYRMATALTGVRA